MIKVVQRKEEGSTRILTTQSDLFVFFHPTCAIHALSIVFPPAFVEIMCSLSHEIFFKTDFTGFFFSNERVLSLVSYTAISCGLRFYLNASPKNGIVFLKRTYKMFPISDLLQDVLLRFLTGRNGVRHKNARKDARTCNVFSRNVLRLTHRFCSVYV
ncbi:transmembrane protein, putative [Bodo saltans]|uniref:Transmembrane protein, putative n=1 Tax=Bodo saltans TaxID=75058 RepID=A0A0S4J4R6_BODSA|nr:transmembrane protein, putative [Bodo saltans]|eukprot:CUG46943.1 transmembrane protein, putative [Bodo saltans]